MAPFCPPQLDKQDLLVLAPVFSNFSCLPKPSYALLLHPQAFAHTTPSACHTDSFLSGLFHLPFETQLWHHPFQEAFWTPTGGNTYFGSLA